ncbi:MAG: DUF2189 domain-containing protein [Alphaproteobacteria bacterium]|nr:MAG: DUF2189 domain-containing protein [Alphaproteobacteria bacterium]
MPNVIRDPGNWLAQETQAGLSFLAQGLRRLRRHEASLPEVRRLSLSDLSAALRAGWDDFQALRSDAMFLCLFYPVAGLVLFFLVSAGSLLPLLGPLVVGFALLGPVFASGLYEMSRRRAAGELAGWKDAVALLGRPVIVPIVVLGGYYMFLFGFWLLAAMVIHAVTLGPEMPSSLWAFMHETFSTFAGWEMLILGTLVGGAFMLAALATSFAFPLLVDRDISLPGAVATSIRIMQRNPLTVLAWGALVGALLLVGSVPFLVGLIVVFPLLGHATWHLCRRAVG